MCQGGGECGVAHVGSIVSVAKVMGAELSRPRPAYERAVVLRLEDSGVSNVGGVANMSKEQDRACPSRSEHGYSTRWQVEGLNKLGEPFVVATPYVFPAAPFVYACVRCVWNGR